MSTKTTHICALAGCHQPISTDGEGNPIIIIELPDNEITMYCCDAHRFDALVLAGVMRKQKNVAAVKATST